MPSGAMRPPLPRKPTPLRLSTLAEEEISTVSNSSSSQARRNAFLNSPPAWIALYFVFNMGLTLYNKTVLVHFPFPYLITALHTFCGTVGCLWLKHIGYFTPAQLPLRRHLTLALFSILYTVNIAISNVSLQLVTVPFHQVVRASAPVFTILVAYMIGSSRGKGFLGVPYSKLLSLLPVIAGVGFATYGDYSFTAWGFVLTLFGTFLAALKTVLTNVLQTPATASKLETPLPMSAVSPGTAHRHSPPIEYRNGPPPVQFLQTPTSPSYHSDFHTAKLNAQQRSHHGTSFHSISATLARRLSFLKNSAAPLVKHFEFVTKRFDMDFGMQQQQILPSTIKLHPLDLLLRMSPLAFVQCIVYAYLSGEIDRAIVHPGPGRTGWTKQSATILLMNGVIAFLLNIVSLTANQKNGPLTMTVAANVKQVLTILLAMYMFNLAVTIPNAIGITLTLAGGAWYGALEYQEKKKRIQGR